MPLSNNSHYGVEPMTEAINRLPDSPSIIRDLKIFKPEYLDTTYVKVEAKNGELSLVKAVPRGTPGEPVKEAKRENQAVFEMLHLPKHEVVRADDVQNKKAFGKGNKVETVADAVVDKLGSMKSDIQYTQEHLMLGALMGKILDADGSVLEDLYKRFGMTRKVFNFELSSDTTNVGMLIDSMKTFQSKKRKSESLTGWIVLASEEFMQQLIYHKSVYELYARYQSGEVYRNGDTEVSFRHKNIDFIQYDHTFESGLEIPEGEALLLPNGTRSTFKEFYAPADMKEAVNTKAKPYYASREPLPHGKGWDLEAQSNPLPLCLRPELMATLKMT